MVYNNNVLKKLKSLSPERNVFIRAYLYSVGFWGTVHMISSVSQAAYRHNASLVNALRIANISSPVVRVVDTPLFFIGGWAVFWAGYILIYRLLRRRQGVLGSPPDIPHHPRVKNRPAQHPAGHDRRP